MDYLPMVTLEGVDGSQWPISSIGSPGDVWLAEGARGLDMPVFDTQSDKFPNIHGSKPRSSRGDTREIFLPLIIWGDTREKAVATKRRLLRALNPIQMFNRMARLVVSEASSDGVYEPRREIEVYYDDGLNGKEGEENGRNYYRFGLILQATDPFFRALTDVRVPFFAYGETEKFFPPEDESFVSPDGISGGFQLTPAPTFTTEITVENPGDIPAYPTWNFTGPLEGPFNLVRDATLMSPEGILSINSLSLAEGESATLVTEKGKVSLTTSVGADVTWTSLAVNPQFWTLDHGLNIVRIVDLPVGIEPANADITFRPRFNGM